jgi:hypothetical protein
MICQDLRASLYCTASEAREKPIKKTATPSAVVKRKKGRPGKDELPRSKEPTKLELQLTRTLEENPINIPVVCDCT